MDAPAIVQSPDGSKIAAAWMDHRNGNAKPGVFLSLAQGGRFAKEGCISTQEGARQNHPTLAFDPKNQIIFGVWESTGGSKSIRGCALGKSRAEWAVSDDAEGPCSFPVVACGGSLAVVVYEAKDASEVHLRLLPAK